MLAGQVRVNGQPATKAGASVDADAAIVVDGPDHPWVSRGGIKLAHALDAFGLDVRGAEALDIGASTGGFTDVLLHRGAVRVVALDVGHNQIDWRLRNDPRVHVREGVNARYLQAQDFPTPFDLVVVDVSFISATKVLPAIVPLLRDGGSIVTLIKPQFEVGRGEVGGGGIVRDPAKRAEAIATVNHAALELGLSIAGVIESPIQGAEGNVEFLALYARS